MGKIKTLTAVIRRRTLGNGKRELVVSSAQATDEEKLSRNYFGLCVRWVNGGAALPGGGEQTLTTTGRPAARPHTPSPFAPNRHQNMASDSKHTAQLKSGEYRRREMCRREKYTFFYTLVYFHTHTGALLQS